MRVLVIGNSHTASVFAECLCANKENLVFTTAKNTSANYVDILPSDVSELKDFALANELNMAIVTDIELMRCDFVKEFHEANLTIFAPDPDALKIVSERSFGKKFMYKNKIQTPKFGVFDKAQLAVEYARASNYPIVIKSDEPTTVWPDTTCKTFAKAAIAIEKLFDEGTKKIVIQSFVEGREFSYYVLTDGYNIMPLDSVATLDNKYAYLDANFVDADLQKKIAENIIRPVISALERFNTGYVGILGIDFILTDRNELYALEFRPFFNDLDVELFAFAVEDDWLTLFNSAIVGSLLDDFSQIKKSERCYITAKTDEGYITEEGSTLNQAREKLAEFNNLDGVCAWKF